MYNLCGSMVTVFAKRPDIPPADGSDLIGILAANLKQLDFIPSLQDS